jgi:hypothetical protein
MRTNIPLIKTKFAPSQLIGPDNMRLLVEHCRNFRQAVTNGKTPKTSIAMAKVIDRLQDNGYVIGDLDGNDGLRFSFVCKSMVQQIFEGPELSEIMKMTIPQMQAKARGGYKQISNKDEWRNVSKRDVDQEQFAF